MCIRDRDNWDQTTAQQDVANALSQYGDKIEVVFCNNDAMALACRDYLQANGVSVKMSRISNSTNTSINNMAKEANNWGADYVVSIHNNAGGGDGFEVYHTIGGGRGKTLATNIEAQYRTEYSIKALTDAGKEVECL